MTDTVKTTVLPAGAAKGVNKKTAPMTARHLKDEKIAAKPKRTRKAPAKKAAPAKVKATATKAQRAAGTITTVDIATEQGISAKTLRARIRRNIDDWAPLFKDGEKHVFADNKTTRNKITALLS
jgi:hypothetical protein